jgi:hypothetical protein
MHLLMLSGLVLSKTFTVAALLCSFMQPHMQHGMTTKEIYVCSGDGRWCAGRALTSGSSAISTFLCSAIQPHMKQGHIQHDTLIKGSNGVQAALTSRSSAMSTGAAMPMWW